MENTNISRLAVSSTTPTEIEKFNILKSELVKLMQFNGVTCKSKDIDLSSLDSTVLKTANKNLMDQIRGLQCAMSEQYISNRNLITNILKNMYLRAPDPFVNSIEEDDLIEVYNLENIQVFRNLKFYETTTYSLEDLLLYDWPELYSRPKKMTQQLLDLVASVISQPDTEFTKEMSDIPAHYLKEIKATPMQISEVRFRYISPITDLAGNKAGFIVSCKARSMKGEIEPAELDFI